MIAQRLVLAVATPPLHVRRRIAAVERIIGLQISDQDAQAIHEACRIDDVTWGTYLHWYVQKGLLARELRTPGKARLQSLIDRLDESDYAPLLDLDPARGWLFCIPHHGHYVLSMTALAARLSRLRPTLVFYASPGTHPGNGVFDRVHACLFGSNANVTIVHDTAAGMARVLRALRQRAAVILMPDAVRDAASALYVPFFDRPLPVQLGAARMARTTDAQLVPTLWKGGTQDFSFATVQGAPIPQEPKVDDVELAKEDLLFRDYRTTNALFRRFEEGMRGQITRWQHLRSHFAGRPRFPVIDLASIGETANFVFDDPRLKSLQVPALALD